MGVYISLGECEFVNKNESKMFEEFNNFENIHEYMKSNDHLLVCLGYGGIK